MPLYYEGFYEARQSIFNMDREDLLDYIDGLYGRDNLSEGFTFEELQREALMQCKKDFTDTSSNEYEQVQFYIKLYGAMKESRYQWKKYFM